MRYLPRILIVLSILAPGLAFASYLDLPAERFSWELYAGAYQPGQSEVRIQDFAFTPNPILIRVGGSVRWTNKDASSHTVTSGSGLFDSGTLLPDDRFEWTFDAPGTYLYHCSIHPTMQASVIVAEQLPPVFLPIIMR